MYRKLLSFAMVLGLTASLASPASAQETAEEGSIWPANDVSVAEGPAMEQAEPFQVNGSVLQIAYFATAEEARHAFLSGDTSMMRAATDPQAKPYGLFLQTDTIGEPSYIVLDMSWLSEQDFGAIPQLETGQTIDGQYETVAVLVRQQADNSFLAIQYEALAKGSMVNNTDWGVQEEYTTRDDSINAHVNNVPDDDEALAQRGDDDDDDDDEEEEEAGEE